MKQCAFSRRTLILAFVVLLTGVTLTAADDASIGGPAAIEMQGGNAAANWTSLLPPVVAVVLAVVLRETLVALFAAVWTGVLVLSTSSDGTAWRVGESLIASIDVLIEQLVPADGDTAHVQIILFTMFLGSVISLMSASGGTQALVDRLTPVTRSRRGGQMTVCLGGLVVFFDDYANSLLLGSTMRPVTDRLRISREKLAFLVDTTAAPVAGLALVSTWVGFEVGLIGDSFSRLAESHPDVVTFSGDAYGTFMATLPYRFYPWFALAFVMVIAWTGRDFGPMWAAERRALHDDRNGKGAAHPQAMDAVERATDRDEVESNGTMWNAIVPLVVLLAGIVIGFWVTGRGAIEAASPSVWQVVSNADTNRVLVVTSFLASVIAVGLAVGTLSLSLKQAAHAWVDGAKSMLLAAMILVLAWAVAMVCDEDHLNTAGYLVNLTTGQLDVRWMSSVAFLLSAAVAFATGTSWATMGLLIPLITNVTFALMQDEPSLLAGIAIERHPLMLASIGSVLAGSILGDHCSPISDTTVLSSVAADCDHLAHVETQMPYAMTVGLITVVCGCVPIGFGLPWWLAMPMGLISTLIVVRFVGRQPKVTE
ncbi:MAG: hypothetical protein KDA93_14590 [Planctomycetaceae bacterium]|nr:hypothetical protein [Planctomycetaceae bacterium]